MTKAVIALTVSIAAFLGAMYAAHAAEIQLVCTSSLAPAYRELIPQFESASGYRVIVTFGNAGAVKKRLQSSQGADLVISTTDLIDDLEKQGKIVGGSQIDVAAVGIGVAIRAGQSKPDISSTEAFKKAMLAARAVAYTDPANGSAAGMYVAGMLDRIGLTQSIKAKSELLSGGGAIIEAVAKGDAEIGLLQSSEIVAAHGVELAGPLPADIQNMTQYTAALISGAKEPDGAKALIKFLTAPAAAQVIRAKGLEPVAK